MNDDARKTTHLAEPGDYRRETLPLENPAAYAGAHPVQEGAASYFLAGGPVGVLLLHGFTSSPAEVRPMGDYLAGLGYTVYSPRLAGHGTTPEDLRLTSWRDWVNSAEWGLHVLRKHGCREIALVGLSLGGSISLYLAAQDPAAYSAVVTMNSPVFIPPVFQPALRWLGAGPVPFFDKGLADTMTQPETGRHPLTYTRTPLAAVANLIELLSNVNSRLPQVVTPALVIYSRLDRLVPPFNAMRIYSQIRSPDKRLMVLHKGRHVVTTGADAREVFPAVGGFLAEYVAGRAALPSPI